MPSSPDPAVDTAARALDASDVGAIRELRDALERASFAELIHLLRPAGEQDLPWPDFTNLSRQLDGLAPERAGVVRLFGLGETVPTREVERWLPARLLAALEAAGLLRFARAGEVSTAGLCVVPFAGLYVLANPPPSFPTAWRRQQDVCLDRDSVFVARQLAPRRVARTLEVCSGSGLLALTAARWSDAVVGCELSETAIAAARFSAVLSGLEDKVEFRPSDLCAAADGEFDLILANPPYAPVPPGSCDTFLSGDGGRDGLALVRRLVLELPARLAEGGRAMIIAGALEGASGLLAADELRALFAGAGLSGHLFVIDRKRAEDHIAQMRPFVDRAQHYEDALARYCQEVGATHYVGFYLVLERRPGAAPLEIVSPLATRSELVRALRQRRQAREARC
ncbi:MAG: methyltransferase [Kofleriaceae bacterium]